MLLLWSLILAGDFGLDPVWRASLDEWDLYPDRSYGLVAVADNGAALLADPKTCSLALADGGGALKARVGGRGRGPGEYQNISAVGWAAEPAVFMVADRFNGRLTLLDRDGSRQREIRVEGPFRDPVFDQAGGLIFKRRGGADGFSHTVFLLALDGSGPHELFSAEAPRIATWMEWNPRLVFAGGKGFVAVNAGTSAEILFLDPRSGRKQAAVKAAMPRPELSDDYYEARMRELEKSAKGTPLATLQRLTRRETHWPPMHSLLVDDRNRLWVFGHGETLWGPRPFLVFDNSGKALGSGQAPGAAQAIRGGFLYAITEEADALWLEKLKMKE